MTYAEYLAAEAVAEVRHEFLNGEVWAMAGGTPQHGALAAAMTRGAARGAARQAVPRLLLRRPRAHPGDRAVHLPGPLGRLRPARDGPDDKDAITNPIVLVEVLSDSTEAYDRGAKSAHYRRIPSLREYVLVSQGEPRVEVFRRIEAGRWELLEARPGETIELASLGVRLDVAAIYA